MTATSANTSAPVEILEVLTRHYGEPQPGSQEQELNNAVAKLIAVAAHQRAMRQLWKHADGCWDRLKAELNPQQKGAH